MKSVFAVEIKMENQLQGMPGFAFHGYAAGPTGQARFAFD
jgi:hypothetical protein